MSTVTIYSKNPNDVKFCLFHHVYKDAAKPETVIDSRPFKEIVIKGLNNYLRENKMLVLHTGNLAKTEVDESLWNEIVEDRGDADQLLVNRVIFAAKSDREAHAKLKDASKFISDLKTPKEIEAGDTLITKTLK
jgi:hypothetical protein